MNNYRTNPIEIIRRRKEFNNSFREICDKAFSIPTALEDEDWGEDEKVKDAINNYSLQEVELRRLNLLTSYIRTYQILDAYIQDGIEDMPVNELTQVDTSILSAKDVYEVLTGLLPSYAEAILSMIADAQVHVLESMICALNQRDKESFISILQNERGNIHDLLSLCAIVRNNNPEHVENLMGETIEVFDAEEESVEQIQWNEETLWGKTILTLKEIKDTFANTDIDDTNAIEEIIQNRSDELMQLYVGVLIYYKACLENNNFLSDEQKSVLLKLIHAPHIEQLYVRAIEEVDAILNETEESQVEPIKTENNKFTLPDDFFSDIKYKDKNVPEHIKGLKFISLGEKGVDNFVRVVNILENLRCIEEGELSKLNFVRAFTGRSPIIPHLQTFEKSRWCGAVSELLFITKYFTHRENGKYKQLAELFEFVDPEEETIFTDLINAEKSQFSAYAKPSPSFSSAIETAFPL